MAPARHKHVRRSRASIVRRRVIRWGIPAGTALALANPAAGLVWPDEQAVRAVPVVKSAVLSARPSPVPMRVAPLTRTEERVSFVEKPPVAVDYKFATERVNVRVEPSDGSSVVDVLKRAQRIGVTGETQSRWVEIVRGEESNWVNGAYLADRKPKPKPKPKPEPSATPSPKEQATPTAEPSATPTQKPAPATNGLSSAPCPTGTDVESGLSANAVKVHRAVCAAFPQVQSYGGLRPGDSGEHGSGRALDIMITGSVGDQIAEWVRANASELGVSEVIWSQRIWTVQRSSEGWRAMEDRGSVTANHYDHVHVTVY